MTSKTTKALKKLASKATISLVAVSLIGCTAAQQQAFMDSGGAQILGSAAGGIIGHQSGRAIEGAAIGFLVTHLIVQQIKSSQMQREYAESRARYAYNENESFKRKYTAAKKSDRRVKYVAVKVPKDKKDPESESGFMLYDPARGKLADNTVYASNKRVSNGSVADIDGKRAMIYSGAM